VLVKQPQRRQNVRYFFEPDADGVAIEVTAAVQGGRAGFGVTCWSSATTAYALGLERDGDYSIVKVVDEEDVEVLAEVEADLDLERTHRVRGECVARGGGRPVLILSVDGEAVAESRDSRAFGPFRGVGLFVTTGETRGEVVFDDFRAREI
jgi:hypothetical protein